MNATKKKAKAKVDVAELAKLVDAATRPNPIELAKRKAVKEAAARAAALADEKARVLAEIMAAHPEEVARMADLERKREAALEFAKIETEELLSGWAARTNKETDSIFRGVGDYVVGRVYQEVERLRRERAVRASASE